MLQISTWVRVLIGLILLVGIAIAVPNAIPSSIRDHMPSWIPKGTVNLGLDLQGGSSILEGIELDQVQKDRVESLMGDIRVNLRKSHIGYRNLEAKGDTVSVTILDRFADAKAIIAKLNPTVSSSLLGVGERAYDVTTNGDTITLKMTEGYKAQTNQQVVNQAIEVVRRRVDELGTRDPDIARQGDDRIIVQEPGLSDPKRLIDLLGKTAKMTFQLVDETADLEQAKKGIVPIGSELLPMEPQQ